MKKIWTVILILISVSTFGTNYYISPKGSDANSGTIGSPWKTLFHACAMATSSGDVINVTAGTYNETQVCNLAVGVSIIGTGTSSCHIISTYSGTNLSNAAIKLASADGTNGNQTISFVDLGSTYFTSPGTTSTQGILVLGRSNVKVHDISIHDFLGSGIYFQGANNFGPACPVVAATGNELYNFTITNNSDRNAHGISNIAVSGFNGMLIHHGTITQTARPLGHNGNNFVIPAVSPGGFSCAAGLKYHHVKSYKKPDDGAKVDFAFHMELWDCQGGMEFYNNEFHGGAQQIDLAGTDITSRSYDLHAPYTYNWYIHDNLFQWDNPLASSPSSYLPVGIDIEANKQWITISNNHFKNVPYPVTMGLNQAFVLGQKNITIEKNLFENSGFTNGDFAFDISVIGSEGLPGKLSNLNIYNNTIVNTHTRAAFYFTLGSGDRLQNVKIINNIVHGVPASGYGYLTFDKATGTKDSFYVQNNLLFNNVNNNNIFLRNNATLPRHFFTSRTKIGNPLFVSTSDFHLRPGSPAIGTGTDVGHGLDLGAFRFSNSGASKKMIHGKKIKSLRLKR